MTLIEIKRAFENFNCAFNISDEEAERIAESVQTPEEFENVWENEDWWLDEA